MMIQRVIGLPALSLSLTNTLQMNKVTRRIINLNNLLTLNGYRFGKKTEYI